MGFRQVADDHTRVVLLASAPADYENITIDEATDPENLYLSDQLLSPLNLDATDSDTLPERVLDESSGAQIFTLRNATGELVFVRQINDSKQIDIATDKFQEFKERGTEVHLLVRRVGKKATVTEAVGDEYDYFMGETDVPKTSTGDGYHKNTVPLSIKKFATNRFIVSGS